jgi:hypothetical protein
MYSACLEITALIHSIVTSQIEYSAVWCARMLDLRNRVRVVIPEGVEDLVVLRAGRFELRQVKSRDESVGAWSITNVMPVLGAQYGRSYAFGSRAFSFHFVSDARADVRIDKKIGSLQVLKEVLDLNRRGMPLRADEAKSLRLFRERMPKLILPYVRPANGAACDEQQVDTFLLATRIDTNDAEFRTPPRLDLLDAGLNAAQPHHPRRTVPELREIYDRLLLLIVRRIRSGIDLASRAIRRADVLECCEPVMRETSPDFDRLYPGRTKLEAKVLFGGFDLHEAKQFRQQLSRAKVRRREIAAMKLEGEVEDLEVALGELQRRERRALASLIPQPYPFGPALLECVRPSLHSIATSYLPSTARPDGMLCQGLLWEQTQRCLSAWHPPVSSDGADSPQFGAHLQHVQPGAQRGLWNNQPLRPGRDNVVRAFQ